MTVTAEGLSDSVRVAVLPATLDASLVSYAGTAQKDTIVRPGRLGPPVLPPDTVVFTAPDTLVVASVGTLQFDTGSVYVAVQLDSGVAWGTVTSVSPHLLKVVFTSPAVGPVVVHRLRLVTGDSALGTINIDSLAFKSVAVSRQRYRGTVRVVGDTLAIAAGPGILFDEYAAARMDTVGLAIFSRTASQLRALSPATHSGYVTVTNARVTRSGIGYGYLDSLTTTARYGVAAATFPGAILTGGRLLDTVTVVATANATFMPYGNYAVSVPANYPCGGCRYEVLWLLASPNLLKFIAPVAVDGPIFIAQVAVGSAVLSMYSRAALVASGVTTAEPNEPGNDSAAGATALPAQSGYDLLGALNGSTDTSDYYTFPVPAAAHIYVGWDSPDSLGIVVCDSLVAGTCGPTNDILRGSGMIPAGGRAWVRVSTGSPTPEFVAYHVTVWVSLTGVRAP